MQEKHELTVTDDTPEVLTVPEVAARLRCSNPTVHKLIEQGALRAFRLGGGPSTHWRIYADSVSNYIEAQSA